MRRFSIGGHSRYRRVHRFTGMYLCLSYVRLTSSAGLTLWVFGFNRSTNQLLRFVGFKHFHGANQI